MTKIIKVSDLLSLHIEKAEYIKEKNQYRLTLSLFANNTYLKTFVRIAKNNYIKYYSFKYDGKYYTFKMED